MESSLDLGHQGPEMPPKHGQTCGYEGTLLTGSWHLPAVSTKITSWPLQATDLERSSRWRLEIRHSALGKTQKNRPSGSRMFSGKGFYEPSFSPLLAPRETLMSWPNVWSWFSWLAPRELFCFSQSLGHVSLTFLLSLFLLENNKSPSDSLTRIFPGQHPDDAETCRLIVPWTLISLRKCILAESRQREPRAPWCPYSLKKPEWSSPLSPETGFPNAWEGK